MQNEDWSVDIYDRRNTNMIVSEFKLSSLKYEWKFKKKNLSNTNSHSIPFILFKNNEIILKFKENKKSAKNKTDSNERNQYEMIFNDIEKDSVLK